MIRLAGLFLAACLLLTASAAGDSGGKLGELQTRISEARAKEARLTQQISGLTSDIRSLEAQVGDVSQKVSMLERDLELHQRRLNKLNSLYAFQTERLNFLRRAYAKAVHELNLRMIDLYTTPDPTLVEVIIESDSFQDVLDRINYLGAVAQQDKHIAARVRGARDEVRTTRQRTKTVRARVHSETQIVAFRTRQQRDVRNALLAERGHLSSDRSQQKRELVSTRKQRQAWVDEANALAAADASVRGQLAASQGAGDTTPSAAGLIWPVSGPITSPFGYRWGRLHAGIDIGASSGTPIRAAAAGTVALAAWTGGYGNYTCVDHGGGLATCYAHQSGYAVSSGAHVSQGQVIGYVGNTGHSFGPHLHFEVRINGNPVDPLGYL